MSIGSGVCTGLPQLRSENSTFTKSDTDDRESAAFRYPQEKLIEALPCGTPWTALLEFFVLSVLIFQVTFIMHI
jgi:hypothetical protein